jgi:hypothetical protein
LKRADAAVLALIIVVAGCATARDSGEPHEGCADVIAADMTVQGSMYQISATVSSADTGWDKYADAWVVRTPGGEILGTRQLTHPHVDEQPFTRSLAGVEIPAGVDRVEVAARDSVKGFCGDTVVVEVPEEK